MTDNVVGTFVADVATQPTTRLIRVGQQTVEVVYAPIPNITVGQISVSVASQPIPNITVGQIRAEVLMPWMSVNLGAFSVDILTPSDAAEGATGDYYQPRPYEAARKTRVSLTPNRLNLILNPTFNTLGSLPLCTQGSKSLSDFPSSLFTPNYGPWTLNTTIYGGASLEGTQTVGFPIGVDGEIRLYFPQTRIPPTLGPLTASVWATAVPNGHTDPVETFVGWGLDYVQTDASKLADKDLVRHNGDDLAYTLVFGTPAYTAGTGWTALATVTNTTNQTQDYYYSGIGIQLTDGSTAGTTDADGNFSPYTGTFFQYRVAPGMEATAIVTIPSAPSGLAVSKFVTMLESGNQDPIFAQSITGVPFIRGTMLQNNIPTKVTRQRYVPDQSQEQYLSIAVAPYIFVRSRRAAIVTLEGPLIEPSWRAQDYFDGDGGGNPWNDRAEYAWEDAPYMSISRGWPGRAQSVRSLEQLFNMFLPYPAPWETYVTDDPQD